MCPWQLSLPGGNAAGSQRRNGCTHNYIIFSDVAVEREVEGDLILGDLGQGVPFRAGAFDGAVSISTLQWLCNADKITHNPAKRLYKFFSSLFACLVSSKLNQSLKRESTKVWVT